MEQSKIIDTLETYQAPDWIRHDPIRLRIKPQWANTTTRAEAEAARMEVDEDEIEEGDADEDSSAGYALMKLCT